MQTLGRLTAVVLAAATVTAIPASTHAAPSWTTIERMDGAKHQACKVPVNDGNAWRIRNRLVNGDQVRVGAGMQVLRNGEETSRKWRSGLVRRGHTSAVGGVTMPRNDDRFTLSAWMYEAQAGGGSSLGIDDIARC